MLEKFEKILGNAPAENTFKTSFGEIQNLRDLRTQLYARGKAFYKEYASDDNHFANWVENIFNDDELAQSLRNAKSFGSTLKVLDDRIRYLELYVHHNKKKEELTNYLASMQTMNFEPEHHRFETLTNLDLSGAMHLMPQKKNDVEMLKRLKEQYTKEKTLSFFDRFFRK